MDRALRMTHLGFTEELFPAGTHMCYIYNDEAERNKLIPQFLQSGLAGNEKVACFVDHISPDKLRDVLRELGVDASALEQLGQLSIAEAQKVYCPDGLFLPERMLETLSEYYESAMAAGYAGARVTGEMTWALNGCEGSERLVEYEMKINDLAVRHPITALCQYDARRFDGATLLEVLQVHPVMVVAGQVVRNPYFRFASAEK